MAPSVLASAAGSSDKLRAILIQQRTWTNLHSHQLPTSWRQAWSRLHSIRCNQAICKPGPAASVEPDTPLKGITLSMHPGFTRSRRQDGCIGTETESTGDHFQDPTWSRNGSRRHVTRHQQLAVVSW